jgi:RNA polymerase sigma-70 factor (ECF subfamily)
MEATITDLYFNNQRQLKAKLDPVTDEQLILEYRRTGNRELYAQLVYRYERELFTYLRRYLGSAELAEDVFQATFLMVHLKCEMFEEGRSFRPWLYTIATNKAIDASRHQKRHKSVSLDLTREKDDTEVGALSEILQSSDAEPFEALSTSERSQLIRAALDQLPESMMTVIQLVYYQGLKYREAAEVMNVPVGTVKSRLHAAIAKLSEVWKTTQVD